MKKYTGNLLNTFPSVSGIAPHSVDRQKIQTLSWLLSAFPNLFGWLDLGL